MWIQGRPGRAARHGRTPLPADTRPAWVPVDRRASGGSFPIQRHRAHVIVRAGFGVEHVRAGSVLLVEHPLLDRRGVDGLSSVRIPYPASRFNACSRIPEPRRLTTPEGEPTSRAPRAA